MSDLQRLLQRLGEAAGENRWLIRNRKSAPGTTFRALRYKLKKLGID